MKSSRLFRFTNTIKPSTTKQCIQIASLTSLSLLVAACSFQSSHALPSHTVSTDIKPQHVQAYKTSESAELIIEKAAKVLPSEAQLSYHQREFSAFIHFGPNTFTAKEWGNGMENPAIFNPSKLDTDQWCQTMKLAGMKTVILTAKHHDGFVLWQSRYTEHGVMSSPFKAGKADVVKALADSCRAQGLKLGVYLSPADLYQIEAADGLYGNLSEYSPRTIPKQVSGRPFTDKRTFTVQADDYNEYFMSQLFELLTEYGPIHEVWFDGAHPKRKGGQKYIRAQWYQMINALAPQAVIFGGPDVRWVGNESGDTRDSEWSVIPVEHGLTNLDRRAEDLGSRARILADNYQVYGKDYQADRLVYMIAEVNTSIRKGWFFRDDTHQDVRSTDDVFDIYERSVGGNGSFLLNIPPNREGRFSPRDVKVLLELGERIRETYGIDLLQGAKGPESVLDGNDSSFWQTNELVNDSDNYNIRDSDKKNSFEITLPNKKLINRFVLQEAIATHSQRIEEHALDAWLDGQWQEVAAATTVGYKKILRFAPIETSKFRVRIIEGRLQPTVMSVAAHYYQPRPSSIVIGKNIDGKVSLTAVEHTFKWKKQTKAFDKEAKLAKTHFYYTVDGSEPTINSSLYSQPFSMGSGTVKARAFIKESGITTGGAVASKTFGITKQGWKLLTVSSENSPCQNPKFPACLAKYAFDDNPATSWLTANDTYAQAEGALTKGVIAGDFIALDLGREYALSAFTYLPRQDSQAEGVVVAGMIEQGTIEISDDGKSWLTIERFEFGNIVNDPVMRTHYFKQSVTTRYIKIISNSNAQGSKQAGAAELGFLAID